MDLAKRLIRDENVWRNKTYAILPPTHEFAIRFLDSCVKMANPKFWECVTKINHPLPRVVAGSFTSTALKDMLTGDGFDFQDVDVWFFTKMSFPDYAGQLENDLELPYETAEIAIPKEEQQSVRHEKKMQCFNFFTDVSTKPIQWINLTCPRIPDDESRAFKVISQFDLMPTKIAIDLTDFSVTVYKQALVCALTGTMPVPREYLLFERHHYFWCRSPGHGCVKNQYYTFSKTHPFQKIVSRVLTQNGITEAAIRDMICHHLRTSTRHSGLKALIDSFPGRKHVIVSAVLVKRIRKYIEKGYTMKPKQNMHFWHGIYDFERPSFHYHV